MLELLKNAIGAAPMGCKVDVTFNDDQSIKNSTIIAADTIGIVIENKNMNILHTMIPWTAIGVLDVHQY